MATTPNTNINIPYSAFLDPTTGRPSQEWLLWLINPSFISINISGALPVASGGTGLSTIPTNGQLLIGNGTGYTLATLTPGSGIGVSNSAGSITVSNTGVVSFSGGSTGLTPASATTGAVSLAGTLGAGFGGTGIASYAIGDIIYASGATALSRLADVATGNALISGGVTTAPSWGKIGLTTHVSGTLPIANGGTNGTATPTAGAIAYGTGSAIAYTAAGTTGQVLTSATAGTPTWTTPTTGTVTSVSGTGTVNGLTLSGTVTTSGSLTLGGTLSGTASININGTVGATTPATGAFTTLSATGLTDLSAAGAGQIKFPATQNASANANTLDDYKEGTFTVTDNSGAGMSITTVSANYTKIGRGVIISMQAGLPSTSSTAAVALGGLPFATLSICTYAPRTGNTSVYIGYVGAGSSVMVLETSAAVAITNIQMSNYSVITGFCYQV